MAEEMELKQGQVLELEQVLEQELKWGKVQGLELGLQGMPQSPV